MHEIGITCKIRKESKHRKYNSYKGKVGKTFDNLLKRDFKADEPWQKIGTDVTEFKQSWGKAYFAPAYDFASKEIVAWSIAKSPDFKQQTEMLDVLLAKKPAGKCPILHSDMGWQYQHKTYCQRLVQAGVIQSMSRKGNCIDNGATEQIFGHIKDEFFKDQEYSNYDEFKNALNSYIIHWNTKRRQVKLKGMTPEEFRAQYQVA